VKIIVKQTNDTVEAGILSDSYFKQGDPQVALQALKSWETAYKDFIARSRVIIKKLGGKDDLQIRWELGELVQEFLATHKDVELIDYQTSIARDIKIPPTQKSDVGYSGSDVEAILSLRKMFPTRGEIDIRISWNLFYFTHQVLEANQESKGDQSPGEEQLVDDLVEIANYQARLATKGNGAAMKVTRQLVEVMVKHGFLNKGMPST
jgi:hypothetical protein